MFYLICVKNLFARLFFTLICCLSSHLPLLFSLSIFISFLRDFWIVFFLWVYFIRVYCLHFMRYFFLFGFMCFLHTRFFSSKNARLRLFYFWIFQSCNFTNKPQKEIILLSHVAINWYKTSGKRIINDKLTRDFLNYKDYNEWR